MNQEVKLTVLKQLYSELSLEDNSKLNPGQYLDREISKTLNNLKKQKTKTNEKRNFR